LFSALFGKINVTLYPGSAVVYSSLMRLIINYVKPGPSTVFPHGIAIDTAN
jgi:hypothetical protein